MVWLDVWLSMHIQEFNRVVNACYEMCVVGSGEAI